MFSGIKDSLTSSAAKSMLASRLARYGNLTELRIRSREKSIFAELLLEGDERPISIQIERYGIFTRREESVIVVESVVASRPWVQNLLQDLLVGVPIPVPAVILLALGKPERELT